MKKGIMNYVLALQECGYPSAAAARCGVSPSTLISSLKRMEGELGTILYDRNTRKLTQAGSLYADACSAILAEDEKLRETLEGLQSGKLTVGHASYIDRQLLSLLSIEYFRDPEKHGDLRILYAAEDDPSASLINGEFDLFIGCQHVQAPPRLLFLPLLYAPLYLAVSDSLDCDPDHPLQSVRGMRMITLFQGSELQRLQFQLSEQNGTLPEILLDTNSTVLTENLVSGGVGYSIVNAGIARSLTRCRLYPIPDSGMTIGIWVTRQKEKQPEVQKLYELICSSVESLYADDPHAVILFHRKEA
ncbi:MAG: LysR family transcriptional regulator [Lachnospiraceae bacterium]|nr:LysR family transcriptional regulator [Lachnospiraceae bacterium]